MALDIAGNIQRFEAGDTRQFTHTASVTAPATVGFVIFNTDGATLALEAVQSGGIVSNSGAVGLGLFFQNRVLPDTVGYYTYEWTAWDSNSLPYITRGEFEMIKTQAASFFSYANLADVLRDARHIIGRGDITFDEVRPHMQTANDRINGKVGLLYTVPVSPVFPLIQDMEKVFSLWTLYADRYGKESFDVPPAIKTRKEDYDKLLDSWAAGSVALPVQSGTLVFALPQLSMTTEDFKPIFDSRDWKEQRIDPDLVDKDVGDDS